LSLVLSPRESRARAAKKEKRGGKKTREKVKGTLSAALSVVERTQKERGHRNFRLTQKGEQRV
jgi:hypothetical protein